MWRDAVGHATALFDGIRTRTGRTNATVFVGMGLLLVMSNAIVGLGVMTNAFVAKAGTLCMHQGVIQSVETEL